VVHPTHTEEKKEEEEENCISTHTHVKDSF